MFEIILLVLLIAPNGQSETLAMKFKTLAQCEHALKEVPAMAKDSGAAAIAAACTPMQYLKTTDM